MLKEYYKLLVRQLHTKLPELRQIALFNNQYNQTELELPIFCPAVFIQFAAVPWKTTGLHTQESTATITFHLVMDYLMSTHHDAPLENQLQFDEQVLDMVQKLDECLQGWQAKDGEEGPVVSTELTRTDTDQDTGSDGLHVWQLTYTCELIDNTLNRDRDLIPVIIDSLNVSG